MKNSVVNRFFVPWLNEAVRLHEENIAPIEVIEYVCKDIFATTRGPFELMNTTGVPATYDEEKTLELFGSLYKVAEALKQKAKAKESWDWEKRDETYICLIHPIMRKQISDRMLGLVFYICSQILDEGPGNASAIDRGAKIKLGWKKGPIELMRELGEIAVKRLISGTAKLYKMNLPVSIGQNYWKHENCEGK